MDIRIDNPELLKEALTTGINIFAGAGFSVLESPSCDRLPVAKDLGDEICSTFGIDLKFSDDLEMLSCIVNSRSKQKFRDFLCEKYTVNDYNPLYDVIDSINIRSFITTNIDNIIHCVFDNSGRHYLQNIVLRGAVKNDSVAVRYIPLHGDVKNPNAELYFGKNGLANVDDDNKELFHVMEAELLTAPTLFWGYGFHDAGVYRTIAKILEKRQHEIWVQCLSTDEKNISYFRELGCSVIIADTEQLLLWVRQNIVDVDTDIADSEITEILKKFSVPSINQVTPITKKDYFLNAITDWHCILADYPSELSSVTAIHETLLKNKNTLVVGIPFSGKTTLLMQLATKVKRPHIKLYLNECTSECAKLIVNSISSQEAIVFVDDFCDDIEAVKILMAQPTIKVVGVADDYLFETVKHLLENTQYTRIQFGELNQSEAQKIYSKIPDNLKAGSFTFKTTDADKFSMLEMMSANVPDILSSKRIESILRKIRNASIESFDVIAIASYLSVNNSALNTDVLISYFGTTDYQWIISTISGVSNYLSEIDVSLSPDKFDQDYYNLRSRLFLKFTQDILISKFKYDFRAIIRKFILNVPPFKVYKYYVFKRFAYDADIFYRLFNKTAHDLYKTLFKYEGTEFTLQQWALYKSKLKDFRGAFIDIEEAISLNPHNFSIKNTHAMILFDANKDFNSGEALENMKEAMSILEQCFNSDKRKVYHAKKFAEFAVFLAEERSLKCYIPQAEKWLNQIILNGDSATYSTKKLYEKVKKSLKLTSSCP